MIEGNMGKLGKYSALAMSAFLIAFFGAIIGSKVEIRWEGSAGIGAIELATVVLGALSIMLVILTIFLAVLGFIGLSTINDRLEEHSKNYFTDELKEGRPAFAMLKEVVREVVYSGIDPVDDDERFEDEAPDEPTR